MLFKGVRPHSLISRVWVDLFDVRVVQKDLGLLPNCVHAAFQVGRKPKDVLVEALAHRFGSRHEHEALKMACSSERLVTGMLISQQGEIITFI